MLVLMTVETDMEYQYWSFMVSHPAHALLPSVSGAIDVLTWSYAGSFTFLILFWLSFSSRQTACYRRLTLPYPHLAKKNVRSF
jgi:hypothetical protein